MDCAPPQCASLILRWLEEHARQAKAGEGGPRQGSLFNSVAYSDELPAIRTRDELEAAFEHLEYATFRRFQNQLTRAERARLDNTIENALFKIERFLGRTPCPAPDCRGLYESLRARVLEERAQAQRAREQARRADTRLAQLGALSPELFEEFVAELFEALGYQVERMGGTGDEGADLRLSRDGLVAIVQCKYHSRGVIGSPDLQRFLGSIHHHRAHKGFFVTTRTFSLSAERFAAENPIELVEGSRLVELVREALGPAGRVEVPGWF